MSRPLKRSVTQCAYNECQPVEGCACAPNFSIHDRWKPRYGMQVDSIGSRENLTYLEMVREHDPDVPEISTFILPDPRSQRWKRISSYIESFCEGASFVLDNSVSGDSNNPGFRDLQEPRAWVSDWDGSAQLLPPSERTYGRVLNYLELYAVLQKKDKSYVRSLTYSKISLVHQREAFQELFATYISEKPTPQIGLGESSWWNDHFVISFTLPFFAIRFEDREDIRRIFNDRKPFRSRINLSFLGINRPEPKEPSESSTGVFLHRAACAFMITGKSERYWTAAFLDEDFADEVPKLSVEEEEDVAVGGIDPIIVDAKFNSADTIVSPRAYALAALAATLEGIAEHHAYIQEEYAANLYQHTADHRQYTPKRFMSEKHQEWRIQFQESIGHVRNTTLQILRKFNEFLGQDVCISPEGLPCSPQWLSVADEPNAKKSLGRVVASRNRLREISYELDYLVDEARCEVLGILNLIAQIYSGRPEIGDSSAWAGFLFILIFSIVVGGLNLSVLFWEGICLLPDIISSRLHGLWPLFQYVAQAIASFNIVEVMTVSALWIVTTIQRLFTLIVNYFRV
ncbi:unnamed protein product [Fusarium graminearum]|nr:unnamed protein product [Fusarium graminearum]